MFMYLFMCIYAYTGLYMNICNAHSKDTYVCCYVYIFLYIYVSCTYVLSLYIGLTSNAIVAAYKQSVRSAMQSRIPPPVRPSRPPPPPPPPSGPCAVSLPGVHRVRGHADAQPVEDGSVWGLCVFGEAVGGGCEVQIRDHENEPPETDSALWQPGRLSLPLSLPLTSHLSPLFLVTLLL